MASPPPESPTDHPTDETAVAGGSASSDAPVSDGPVDAPASDAPVDAAGDGATIDVPVGDAADPSASVDGPVDAPVDDLGVDELLLDAPVEEASSDADDPPAGEAGVDRAGRIADDWDTDSDVPLVDWDGTAMDVPPGRGATGDDGEDDWGGTDWDGTEWDGMDVGPSEAVRLRRRRWRRRRRVAGTLVFLLIVGGLGYVVARSAGMGDDDSHVASATTTTAPITTSTLPPAGPYTVLDGLNARSGPSSTATVVGTIKIGESVMVLCAAEGDLVNGPKGQSTKWLKITTPFGPVFVTAVYVAVGADLTNFGEDRALHSVTRTRITGAPGLEW